MEQTRNNDDARLKTHETKFRQREVPKNFFEKKERENFCIWLDIKEKIRKRRKNKEEKKD